MQDPASNQPNLTPVVTPNTGSIEGITPVQNTQTTPTILEQNNDNTVVSSLASVANPGLQVQEAFMDQSSLENSGRLDAIDTGSLINQDNYATPKPKLRSSKIPFIITALTLVVALIIAGLGSYFAKRSASVAKNVSQLVSEQSIDSTKLRVDPLSLLSPAGGAGQKLSVNGSAEFLGNITAGSFSGNGSAITNLKAANCDDCVQLQPNTPGLAQVGGINVAGNGLFGKLGVGIQNPAYTVDVLGDINASSSLKINGVTVCTAAGCVPTNGLTSAVTQLDGLNGSLLISNTSGSGTTITINDASTTGKGIAQFSATNFLVSGGTVNTIQDITNASIPTFGGIILNGNVTLGTTGTVFSNNLSQTSAGNAVVVDAAADQITFQANGRTFQFPSTGVANQTICTTGITCVAGGGQAILLTPGSAQTDNTVDVSIFVNDTGGGNLLQLQTAGADKFVVANNGDTSINAVLKVNTITPTASFTVGSSAQTITLQGDASSKLKATSGGGFTSSLGFASPTANNTITIPDASGTVAVSASGNIILSASGNITFTGLLPIANGGTNSSTTGGALANLGAAASGANSDITSTSALTSATGLNNITPTGVFTIGATTQAFTLQGTAASIVTATSGSSSTTLGFATPTANVILNFPALSAGTYSICTNSGNCTGVGGGVSTAGGTNGTLARFNGSQVIGDSIITESGSVITIGGSEVIQGSSGLTIGTGSILGKLLFRDGSSAFADTLQSSTLTANRTVTVPNASGTLAVSASGNISLDALGNITFTGTLPLSSGGTGGTDAVTARTSLSAAMSGANSDITSLSGLTTALSVIQGGTGSTSAGGARTNLSAAQSGANGDITSTTALNTITPSTNLMVGATTQAFTLQGSTASVVTATSGGVATTLGFATPTANVTLNFPALTTGTYSICTNSGNCLGGAAGAANTALSNLTAVAINTSLLPGVAGAINLGSNSLPFGTLSLAGTSGTPGTNNFLITGTSTGGVRTVTLPDASGTVAVSASGNISLSASGNITFTGLLPIANGGTNSSTAGGALINLGAAASGANSDITSTSALATATGLNTITPTGALTVGATTQAFTLQGNDSSVITATGGGFSTSVGFSGTPTGGVAYNFDRSALAGTYTICTTIGNCAGSGGGVTTAGGTAGKIAKFTAGSVIADSIISESGVIVTVAGEAVLQGAGGLTLGQASTATGKIIFNNIGNANTVTLQSGNPGSNVTLTLPITAGANGDCITSNGSGVLSFTACTGGPGGGVTSVDGQIGVLIVANSSGAAGTITIDDATTSSKGIAQFNSTNFTASSGTINTIQNIDSTATPSFSGLSVTTATGLTLGTGTAAGKLVVRDGISAFGSTFQTTTLTGNQVITIPNAGGTLAVSASGNISLSASGDITFTGLLPIANGGTNSSTAGGALTNLGAAASGANSDITSLSGLTTALSVAQGGTALATTPTNGQLLIGNGTNYTLAGLSGTGITVTNGAGSIGLATIYGSGSNTAAQGNVTFTCPSGTGNLSGTGNAITIGSGGTCNSLTVVNNPTFSGLVTGQAGLVVTNGGSLSTQKGTDYAATGVTSDVNLGAASLYRLTGISAQTITGFSGGVDGRILTLINAGSATAILSNLTTSAASNQISTGSGADVNLPIGSTISLIYDSAASLWRVNGTPAGSGLSGVTNDTNVTGVLASNVLTLGWTGTLAVGRGGLGVGSLTSNGILYGNGSSAVQATASAANSVLITDGSSVPALSQTLPTAVQGNITSTGALNSGSITSGFGIIDNGADTITTTGTIGTASTTTFTGNTATFSGGVIAPSLERATAGTLAIGTTSNTTAISEGRSGITTTNAGALTVSQAFSANLGATVTGGDISLNSTGSSNYNTNINTGTSTGSTSIGNSLSGAISLQTSSNVSIGASDTNGTLLVLDTKTSSGDPTGASGGMYYNSNLGKFRCYENAAWKDCIAAPSTLQNAYTQSAGASPSITLTSAFGGISIVDGTSPVVGNLFSIKNNAATATYFGITATGLLIQDASATNALAFDSSTKTLKVYGVSGVGYASVSYTDATSTAVFAAGAGGVSQLGNGNGNVTISLGGATDALNFDKTYTPVAAYSSSDFNVIRNLTGTSYALTGNVLKIEDQSTITSGSSASNLLYINQANTSATGNLILAQTGGSTTKFAVSTAGTVTIAAGQSYTGTGALTVSSGAATALTITGNAASTWSTSTGNLTIQAGGASKVILKPGTDSTSALEVQNAAGTAMFTVDSTNNKLSIGASDTVGSLLIIDTDIDATYQAGAAANAATEVDGGMFYSTANHNFMCGVAGSWQTCTGLLYSNTAIGATISTCTTACSPLGTAPIPANYCKPGRVIHLIARGIWGTSATSLALAVYYGSSTVKASDTLLGVSLPATAALGAASWAWQLDTTLICFSTTTIMAQSQAVFQVASSASTTNATYSTAATAATTVSTASANNLYVFPTFNPTPAAGNYAVATQLIVTGN